jgi:hypothetical protein
MRSKDIPQRLEDPTDRETFSDMSENRARSLRGELYFAFTPELNEARRRCQAACHRYNTDELATRRRRVELWRA